MTFYAYIYYDPSRNNEPIYVGKGKNNRAWKHLKSKKKHPFIQRLQSMSKENVEPIIGLYSGLDEEMALLLEQELISKIGRKDLGKGPLLNLTDGGEQGANKSLETRRKMSKNNLGKVLSQATKDKMSISRKGHKTSLETRKKISIAQKGCIGHMTGKTQTEETKLKISIAQKGKPRGKRFYKEDGSWIMIKAGV